MLFYQSLITLMVLVFFFLGCQKKTSVAMSPMSPMEPSTEPVVPAPIGALPEFGTNFFRAELISQPTPNSYFVQLKWNSQVSSLPVLYLQREAGNADRLNLKSISQQNSEYLDTNVRAGESYRYTLNESADETSPAIDSIEIKIPTDLEITGERTVEQLGSNLNIGRLFLRQGSHLYTEGKNFSLNAEEIHSSPNASIETFSEKSVAAVNKNGRSGGSIKISAKRGFGDLTVSIRGEQGGAGTPGEAGQNGLKGLPGTSCEYQWRVEISGPDKEALEKQIPVVDARWGNYLACLKHPGNGFSGSAASSGGNGGPGRFGGNSGKLYLQIEESAELKLNLIREGGRAGVGGAGGAAGEGGPGGDTGFDVHQICQKAKQGSQGPNGAKGAEGTMGIQGSLESYCLKLKNRVSGACEL